MMVLPGDCGTASALAAAMDVLMPEARRQVPSPAVTPVTRRAVVTNDSSGSYGKNSLSGIGSYLATASRHGIGWLDALTQAAEGNPWIPDTT
jgi:hypothetical protein